MRWERLELNGVRSATRSLFKLAANAKLFDEKKCLLSKSVEMIGSPVPNGTLNRGWPKWGR